MSKNNPRKRCFEESFYNDTPQQQEEKAFHIVLVDIEKAAKDSIIRCVEMPLERVAENVEYVALSYRWGELHETIIDTHVGYTASITSFDLYDFYGLCKKMTQEIDLKPIKYVWVDAICVDQTDYERRKATIYQMTNIYEQAKYIVAVPDLHTGYLQRTMTKNVDIMKGSQRYSDDIYHLIHGNIDQLAAIEKKFLDDVNVPNDPDLRQWLTKYTDHFMEGFMKYKLHGIAHNPTDILDHIYETSQQFSAPSSHPPNNNERRLSGIGQSHMADNTDDNDRSFDGVNHCDKEDCPLKLKSKPSVISTSPIMSLKAINHRSWNRSIYERSTSIRQSMEFLTDLITDWSSRVWVVSEFSIAKKKNNLKFWFTQLEPNMYKLACIVSSRNMGFAFFKFDFNNHQLNALDYNGLAERGIKASNSDNSSNPVYLKYHCTLMTQLDQQTFLEMVLKSKATKNEDRFYSILPLSEYRSMAVSKNGMDQFKNIITLMSVKLKLFEFMTIKDKLNLLFMSGNILTANIGMALPTFATSTISSATPSNYQILNEVHYPCNFDLHDQSTIMLRQLSTIINDTKVNLHYSLHLKPVEYYKITQSREWFSFDNLLNTPLLKRLQIDDVNVSAIDVVYIPFYGEKVRMQRQDIDYIHIGILLIGNSAKNKWILEPWKHSYHRFSDRNCTRHFTDDCSGFDIY